MKLLLLLLFFPISLFGQYWGANTESEFVNEAMAVKVDASGNTYIAGYITGATAFNANIVQSSAQGNGDIYVAKYNSSGNLLWIRQFGGSMSDRAYTMALDGNGNILVAGQYFGQVNFQSQVLQSSANSKDIFILKLSPDGDVLWARSEGGSMAENAYGIATDSQNNVILTGQFSGNSVIGGQNFQSVVNPSENTPSYDLFISKYDSDGNPIWVVTGQAIYEDRGMDVAVDNQNNIYVCGQFSDTLIFAGQQFNNNGYNVGFLAKLNPSGQIQWMNTLRAGLVLPYSLAINSANEVIITGDFRGNLIHTTPSGQHTITNPHQNRIFALKVASNGNQLWQQTLGSDNGLSARAVAVDAAKNVFITGHFTCALTQLHSPASSDFNSVGFRDIYLWKINNSGQVFYTKQIGGKRQDYAHGIAIKSTNEPVICGSYMDDLNFPTNGSGNYTVNNQNYFSLTYTASEAPHVFLHGDASSNSFVTNALNDATVSYNYFFNNSADSLYGFIHPYLDTIHTCHQTQISYNPNTYSHFGPGYNYLWNTSWTEQVLDVYNSGTYSVEVERWDGCSNGGDSIYVEFHDEPALPLLSDSLGIAVLLPSLYHQTYTFCDSGSVDIWFNELDTNLTLNISGPSVNVNDTLPHSYNHEGVYDVTVTSEYCTHTDYFEIKFDQIEEFDIIPYLILVDSLSTNDTLTVCSDEPVVFHVLDSITNPTGIFNLLPETPVLSYSWTITSAQAYTYPSFYQHQPYVLQILPSESGWYYIDYSLTVGYNNTCGIDSMNYALSDSFYIEVLPLPNQSVIITGDDLLCPNGSVYLSIPYTIYDLSWSGPGIAWISSEGDSIQATAAGTYYYHGYQVDTLTGCGIHSSFSYTLYEKTVEPIQSYPDDGVICPYDSILMWVDDIYLSYNWAGPSGTGLSTTNEHVDYEMGFYYCTVLDDEGCYLTTLPFELREYSSPYLTVDPTNVICEDEDLIISAIFIGDGTVNWISPVTGNNPQITTNVPGWYFAELTSCNITVIDSIQIYNGSFTIEIQAADSILCYGSEVIVSAPSGLSDYEWNNGFQGVSQIYVENGGEYWVTAMNAFGCTAISDTVFIEYIHESEPPLSQNITLCDPEDIVLENVSDFITNWFSSDTLFLGDGSTFPISVSGDTTILLTHDQIICPLLFSSIIITLIEPIPNIYSISGPLELCTNASGTYTVNSNTESVQWFIDGLLVGDSSSIEIEAIAFLNSNTLVVVLSNECHSDTLQVVINLIEPAEINLTEDNLLVCANEDLILFLEDNYDTVNWYGNFGNYNGDTLTHNVGLLDDIIYVSALDHNGCQTNLDSIYIQVSHAYINIETDFVGTCLNDSITLAISSNWESISWTTPNGTVTDTAITIAINAITAGWYIVEVVDSIGCSASDSIELHPNPIPTFTGFNDTLVCAGQPFFGHIWVDSVFIDWASAVFSDTIIVFEDQWIEFTVENGFGCTYSDSFYVEVVTCNGEFPNIITANGDGINDYFIVKDALLHPNNLLVIRNRWGQTIFEESGYKNTFDGGNLVEGVYFYLYFKDYLNTPQKQDSGFFHLVR